jgi:protein-S-isoprenylcysteine O-methyltransferase Ste14
VTRSASTPRIRLLQGYYVLLLAAVAVVEPHWSHLPAGRFLEFGGLALIALAVLGRIWATLFIAGRKDTEVINAGPYARCRHPLYVASMVASLGLGLATQSLVLAAITATLSILVHVAAALAEERRLVESPGVDYPHYAARVPRFWPKAAGTATPQALTVNAGIYWKAFLDGASFFGLYLALELITAAREAGSWQTLASIY